jgi:polysaccharide deacetylase family protein (PEP-CTERM system associated)
MLTTSGGEEGSNSNAGTLALRETGDSQRDRECRSSANILTLDIEDWCQSSPQALSGGGMPHPPAPTMRAVDNTRRLLRILDEYKTRATCFVLGSLAEAYPEIVREIHDSGHEIASHGYHHLPVYFHKPEEFRTDVARSLECLERIIEEKIRGYRAPYFSITRGARWALPILADLGLEYDASLFPLHSRYYRFPGWEGAQGGERFPSPLMFADKCLLEVPVTTVRILGQNLPLGGGAFLGLLPLSLFRWAIQSANRSGHPSIFYLHPHDLDDQDLHRHDITLKDRIFQRALRGSRSRNEGRLRRLLAEFPFTSIHEWMRSNPVQAEARRSGV